MGPMAIATKRRIRFFVGDIRVHVMGAAGVACVRLFYDGFGR